MNIGLWYRLGLDPFGRREFDQPAGTKISLEMGLLRGRRMARS